MKEINLWKVRVIADCEGRSTKEIAIFDNAREANNFASSDEGRDMYGRIGDVIPFTLTIFSTAQEAGATSQEELKKEALSKLTQAERTALGL
jgi:hypothetical protein